MSKVAKDNKVILILIVAICAVAYLLFIENRKEEKNNKEFFRLRREDPVQAPVPVPAPAPAPAPVPVEATNPADNTRPQMAQPSFTAPITPRSPILSENSNPLLGQAPTPALAASPQSPMLPSVQPNFSQLGGSGSPVPTGSLTSSQASAALANRLGSSAPVYQDTKDMLPLPDMRQQNGASVDPTDPQSFMYDRTIFGRLKRRYGADVDYFRGDLSIKQENRGWFDTAPATDVDIVTGYFNNFIDISQETAIKDAKFSRSTPVEQLFKNSINPYGSTNKTPYNNI